MAAPATQKTPDQAAALIQARLRGHQQRQREQRVIRAVTTLQARQRARYTRREFQKLLEFYNEQESFLQESKRRQLRLWHREQELYFLQHTTAEELDAIRTFQYDRGARRIQREWRRVHPRQLEDVDVSGLGRPFDPFGLGVVSNRNPLDRASPPKPSIVMEELYGELPKKLAASSDGQHTARRRAEIQERLQRMRKEKEKQSRSPTQPTRRELYTELVSLRQLTAQRLDEVNETYRSKRGQRDLDTAQLSASCRNRVAFLLDEKRLSVLQSSKRSVQPERMATEKSTLESQASAWSEDRKRRAWESHSRTVQSVLGKEKWYETYIAGEKQDIRRVYAESPWKQMWQWPRPASSSPTACSGDKTPLDVSTRELTAMDRFMFCLPDDTEDENRGNNQEEHLLETRPLPLDDKLASVWWRAHATQSHMSYKRLQERRLQLLRRKQLFAGVKSNNHNEDAQVTPEMLANPEFYEFYRRTIDEARDKEHKAAVEAKITQLQHQIQRKVVEVETQIELNTRMIFEERERVLQQKARQTKEERSAIEIQRLARGRLGRKRAQEHMAQYFVMVRGRAIRKGKCEECGEQPAVLECKECEESLHFCPVCWVQVHSTRRRKTHVPIPMAANMASTKPVDHSPHKGTEGSPARPEVSTRQSREQATNRVPVRGPDAEYQPRSTVALVLAASRPAQEATSLDSTSRIVTMEPPKSHEPTGQSYKMPTTKGRTIAAGEQPFVEETKPALAANVVTEEDRTDAKASVIFTERVSAPVAESTDDVIRSKAPNATSNKLSTKAEPSQAEDPPKAKLQTKPRTSLRQRMAAEKPQATEKPTADAASAVLTVHVDEKTDAESSATDAKNNDMPSTPVVVVEPLRDTATDAAIATSPKRGLDEHQAARKIQSLRHQRQAKSPNPKHKNADSDTTNEQVRVD